MLKYQTLKTGQRGEIIVVLDAGGGTIDAATYQIANSYPLRLSEEVVQSDSRHANDSPVMMLTKR